MVTDGQRPFDVFADQVSQYFLHLLMWLVEILRVLILYGE
jgi:hypothetical protein